MDVNLSGPKKNGCGCSIEVLLAAACEFPVLHPYPARRFAVNLTKAGVCVGLGHDCVP